MNQKKLLIFLLFLSKIIFAQDMKPGFKLLETGAYQQAETFFADVLKTYPDNKTALLCYGRAVGLSGEPEKALEIFIDLREKYPDDFEIKLNYAESLLWNGQYKEARIFYQSLIKENDQSFPALLGFANTLSNLKEYDLAMEYITKALASSPGNANALISRKYIRLGQASVFMQDKKYEQALQLLDDNLKDFQNDRDTQLNKINIYNLDGQYEEAEKVYKLLATSRKDSIFSLSGLSLIAHKQKEDKKALELAEEALTMAKALKTDKDIYLPAYERYIQALLWNRKFAEVKEELASLTALYPDDPKVYALKASLGMYTGDFNNSTIFYQNILKKDSTSFDGNLGIANAFRANSDYKQAFLYANQTLRFYPKQTDAENLIKKMKKELTPFIEAGGSYSYDNGDNIAYNQNLSVKVPISFQISALGNYARRETDNDITQTDASSDEVSVGLSYQILGIGKLEGLVGFNSASSFANSYTQSVGSLTFSTKPFKRQDLQVGYKRELQNFNAALIDREIVMNHYLLNYNLGTTFNLGYYLQYMHTSQSDNNTRNLVFSSLYYSILNAPVLKAGINYQYISFEEQLPEIYFSPDQFHVGELFMDFQNSSENRFHYAINAALGLQYVNEDPASTTFRTEVKLGYKISNRFDSLVYGRYSNIASATAAGFRFTEFGIRLRWYFLKKPIFKISE